MEQPSTSQQQGMVSTSWIRQQERSNVKRDPFTTVLEVWTCIKPMGFQHSTLDCWGPSPLLLVCKRSMLQHSSSVQDSCFPDSLPITSKGLLCQMTTFTLPHKTELVAGTCLQTIGTTHLQQQMAFLLRTLKTLNSFQTHSTSPLVVA